MLLLLYINDINNAITCQNKCLADDSVLHRIMFMIAMRSLIPCYLFMVIVIMFMRGIYDDIILP